MDNKKKALMETGIVCALAAVLGLLVMRGPGRSAMRQLWRGSRASVSETSEPAPVNSSPRRTGDAQQSTPTSVSVPTAAPRAGQKTAAPPSDDAKLAQINYTAFTTRDPFVSLLPKINLPVSASDGRGMTSGDKTRTALTPPPQPPPKLNVQGILWGDIKPKAIINERVYRVHETVEGATIMSIDARGVTIEHQGTLISYPVGSSQSDKRSMGRPTVGR